MMDDTEVKGREVNSTALIEEPAMTLPASVEAVTDQPEGWKEVAHYIAILVSESLRTLLQSNVGQSDFTGLPPPMQTGTCNLTGLRRHQFRRFCEIMRANPTESPFRAAKQAIAEFPGRGGYSRASSLQRYAGKHRKCW